MPPAHSRLTAADRAARAAKIARLASDGLTARQIAERLGISVEWVREVQRDTKRHEGASRDA